MRLTNRAGPIAITVAALLLVTSPALAQGRGNGNGKADRNPRPTADRTIGSLPGVYDRAAPRRGNGAGKVPPGWCRGVGNPHNTPENCGYGTRGRYDDRYPAERYPTDRYPRDRYPADQRGAYDSEHTEFHYYLDRKYQDLAARRPLDLEYQILLRTEKRAEHDAWHRRMGVRH